MITKYRYRSDLTAGLGAALIVFAGWLLIYRDGFSPIAIPMLVVGIILFAVGSCYYSFCKGYHPLLGVLSIIFPLAGTMVLFYLPDRRQSP